MDSSIDMPGRPGIAAGLPQWEYDLAYAAERGTPYGPPVNASAPGYLQDIYKCEWCGTPEQSCCCWEAEAGKYRHEVAEATR